MFARKIREKPDALYSKVQFRNPRVHVSYLFREDDNPDLEVQLRLRLDVTLAPKKDAEDSNIGSSGLEYVTMSADVLVDPRTAETSVKNRVEDPFYATYLFNLQNYSSRERKIITRYIQEEGTRILREMDLRDPTLIELDGHLDKIDTSDTIFPQVLEQAIADALTKKENKGGFPPLVLVQG